MRAVLYIFVVMVCFLLNDHLIAQEEISDNIPASDNIETTIINEGKAPIDDAQERLKEADSSIRRMNEENVLLRKVIEEIDTPLTGVEEIIRQEKMRMIFNRVNRNLERIEKMRKEQEHQQNIIKQQQAILNQQRNLPKH